MGKRFTSLVAAVIMLMAVSAQAQVAKQSFR